MEASSTRYHAEYGLIWIVADEAKRLAAATAPDLGLGLVAHHPLAVAGHQDVFVYRKR